MKKSMTHSKMWFYRIMENTCRVDSASHTVLSIPPVVTVPPRHVWPHGGKQEVQTPPHYHIVITAPVGIHYGSSYSYTYSLNKTTFLF